MEIIKFNLKAVPDMAVKVRSFAVTDWYVKPKVLNSLAYRIYMLTEFGNSMSGFDLDRYYVPDDSFPGTYAVYENNLFLCTGLSLDQAKDFCKGAGLVQLGIKQLCF